MKEIKLLLSVMLMYLLFPLIFMELKLTILVNKMNGKIPNDSERKDYVSKMLFRSKILRFCLRMFHTDIETDAIIMVYSNKRSNS